MAEPFAVKEYKLLMDCFRAGVHVPTPIGRVMNYVTMRFIGEEFNAAPQLKDVQLDDPETVLDEILDDYLAMYRDAHYVHGDLSAYNILWWMNKGWFIDMPQGEKVDKWCDMNRIEQVLRRDIKNILVYFAQYGIERDSEHILQVFLHEYIPDNLRNYDELRGPSELFRPGRRLQAEFDT
jgi:RIO kinase 1